MVLNTELFVALFAIFRMLIPNGLAKFQRDQFHSVDATSGDFERISVAHVS